MVVDQGDVPGEVCGVEVEVAGEFEDDVQWLVGQALGRILLRGRD
ncbi:hypothetical protein [Streptomyces sp. NPDC056399]